MYEALLGLQAMHGAAAGAAIWDDLFPLDDPGAPVTIPNMSLAALSADDASLDVPIRAFQGFEHPTYGRSRSINIVLIDFLI